MTTTRRSLSDELADARGKITGVPELPDVVVYVEALEQRIAGQVLEGIRIVSPFLLRTADPPLANCFGRKVLGLRGLGKRIAFGLEDDYWLVIHLMIAGRLHWKDVGAKPPGKRGLAAFDFNNGTLILTEAGTKRRASLHAVRGSDDLDALNPGGLEVFDADLETFSETLTRRNHTLKRALTDAKLFSGIGNAYSDEILHRARLSPVALTQKLDMDQIERLYHATRETLREWLERLRVESRDHFPEKVTAFREGMAVHGRYRQPCPECDAPIQRIRYASNETNYCVNCQTGGRLLADRSLSRLLKKDWPRTLEELERR